MGKLKKLKLNVDEFKEGDIVFNADKTAAFAILSVKKTFLHNHKIGYRTFSLENEYDPYDYVSIESFQLKHIKRLVYRWTE